MEPETKTMAQILPSILPASAAMREPSTPSPTLAKLSEKSNNDRRRQERKRKWLDSYIQLKPAHPKLAELEEEIYKFSASVFYKRLRGQGRGLLIQGANGCGKTHACQKFARWFQDARMSIGPVIQVTQAGHEEAMIPDCSFVHWPEVVRGFKRDQWHVVEDLSNDYLAIIDDIGAEHDPSGFGLEELYLILSRREFKHTIITTNVSPEHWPSRFDRRIASRLFRNITQVDLSEVQDFKMTQ